MISKQPDFQIQSTVTGEAVEMSIDMDALAELFDAMSGLYSDAEMAVIRELSTNARDSHLEAGVTPPIQVTLPAEWGEADLVIQDFGLGMSKQDIIDTYSKYGASTKRNTNLLNGNLGLGSKSPLAYTASFTFVGIKDGVKTTVNVAKGGRVPVMTILDESPTDDPNGVKVIIPSRAYNKFADKAQRLFRFWPEGSVLVNGEAPERLQPKLKITDNIWISNEVNTDIIVMAGVPYPTTLDHGMVREHKIVAFVETGEVAFTPSREALKEDNSDTATKLASILAEFERGLTAAIEADLATATLPREAFAKLHAWRDALGVDAVRKMEFKYKGSTIPTEFKPKGENEKITVSDRYSSKLSAATRYPAVAMEVVVNSLVVHGFDAGAFTPSHKKKLNKYVEDNNIAGVKTYVLLKDGLPKRWLDPALVVDFETIRSIKLPINRSGYGGSNADGSDRIAGSYDIYENGDYNEGVPAEDIDTANPLFYCIIGKGDDQSGSMSSLLNKHKRAYTLVVITSNREKKLKRTFPGIENARTELRKIAKRIAKGITRDELIAAAVQDSNYIKRAIANMDLDRVDDPAFAEAKRLGEIDLSKGNLKKLRAFRYLYLGVHEPERAEVTDPFDNYPLVSASDLCYLSSRDRDNGTMEHRYIYLNAAYAARNSEGAGEWRPTHAANNKEQ